MFNQKKAAAPTGARDRSLSRNPLIHLWVDNAKNLPAADQTLIRRVDSAGNGSGYTKPYIYIYIYKQTNIHRSYIQTYFNRTNYTS